MHVLSRNDSFLVHALLGKFSLQKCRSREIFDLFQVCSRCSFPVPKPVLYQAEVAHNQHGTWHQLNAIGGAPNAWFTCMFKIVYSYFLH